MAADSAVRVVVAGVAGRMGATLARLISRSQGLRVCGGTERPGSPLVGKDGGGFTVVEDLGQAIRSGQGQVVIDFTSPEAAAGHARACADAGAALVIGTTGLGPEAKEALQAAAKKVPVVQSPNMSVGVNVMFKVAAELARVLGPSFDVEIVEAHHRMKKDAPSGTAETLAQRVAAALGRDLEKERRDGRRGDVGARTAGEIGIHTMRGGDVIGDHTVHFLGLGERIEITHRASTRDTFARGAVRAAGRLSEAKPGWHSIESLLGIA